MPLYDESAENDVGTDRVAPAHLRGEDKRDVLEEDATAKTDNSTRNSLATAAEAPVDAPADDRNAESAFVRPRALHMRQPAPEHANASPEETLVLTADDLRYLSELEAAQNAARDAAPDDGNVQPEVDGEQPSGDSGVFHAGDQHPAVDDAPSSEVDASERDIVVEGPGLSGYGTRQITRNELLDEYESMDGLLHEDPPPRLSPHGKVALVVAVLSLLIIIAFEGFFLFNAKSCTPSQGGDESQASSFLDVEPLKRDPNVDRS